MGDATELHTITLIANPPAGARVIHALHRGGIDTAGVYRARGSSVGDPLDRRGVPLQQEKEIVTVVVGGDIVDEIFQLMFQLSSLEERSAPFLYVAKLGRASKYVLPELSESID